MKHNSFNHAIRVIVCVTGLLISSFGFCPSPTPPPPMPRSLSSEDLEKNYHKEREKFQLAQAINETDFGTFKELYDRVDPNFAIPRKGKDPIIPIFRVLELHDQFPPNRRNHGHNCRRLLMLQLLLKRGADPNVSRKDGLHILDLANAAEKKILKQHGAYKATITCPASEDRDPPQLTHTYFQSADRQPHHTSSRCNQ